MTRTAASALAAVALLLGACGGDDGDGKPEQGRQAQQPVKPKQSVLDCLDLSVLSPERATEPNNEVPEIRPLMTDGAQASSILAGDEFGAVVVEYPDAAAASEAYEKARRSKKLRLLGKKRITLRDTVLFLDSSGDAHIAKIVNACIERPDQPPPAP
jgi:hypothetical protein